MVAGDDIVNALEAASPLPISGTTTGVEDGQTVSVNLNGTLYTAVVNANAWTLNVPVADVAAFDPTEAITADVTDLAGNPAPQASRSISVDTVAPFPTIAIDPVTADNILNAAEAAGNVVITGTTTGTNNGDTVTLTLNNGVNTTTYTGTVALDGSFSINVPGSALVSDADRIIAASVSTTDAAGNTGTGTGTRAYTTTVNAPPTAGDDFIGSISGSRPAAGTVATIKVTTNDTDPEGTLDPSTITIAGTSLPGQPLVVSGRGHLERQPRHR